jgi:hypothetical protein
MGKSHLSNPFEKTMIRKETELWNRIKDAEQVDASISRA